MLCPKCNENTKVTDVVHNYKTDEIYRKRQCPKCKYTFYTAEFEVDMTEDFINDWKRNHRNKKKERLEK